MAILMTMVISLNIFFIIFIRTSTFKKLYGFKNSSRNLLQISKGAYFFDLRYMLNDDFKLTMEYFKCNFVAEKLICIQ